MPIKYDDNEKIFNLQTQNTSYVLGVLKDKYLLHLYYGKRINTYKNIEDNMPVLECSCWEGQDVEGMGYSSANLPLEYPCYGSSDYRTPAFHAEYENGSAVTCLEYAGYNIFCNLSA